MAVSAHGLIEDFRRHAIETREVGIEHHALSANHADKRLGVFDWQGFRH